MSYSQFDLQTALTQFELSLIEEPFLSEITPLSPSEWLATSLEIGLNWAINNNTEKARAEAIITPILIELKIKLSKGKISLFSGKDFSVDVGLGLNGVCDYIISFSPNQLLITAPVAVVFEAKREDINSGLGQCIAAMVAAQKFNQQYHREIEIIYGAVTTGDRWRFLKLEGTIVTIDVKEIRIPPVNFVLGILVAISNPETNLTNK
jgi:hypothetical protein